MPNKSYGFPKLYESCQLYALAKPASHTRKRSRIQVAKMKESTNETIISNPTTIKKAGRNHKLYLLCRGHRKNRQQVLTRRVFNV